MRSVSYRKSTNNIAEFSIKDEKIYIVNVRKCFFITPDMKYAYVRALSIFEYWGGVGRFITLCISHGRDIHAPSGCAALLKKWFSHLSTSTCVRCYTHSRLDANNVTPSKISSNFDEIRYNYSGFVVYPL